MSPVETRSVAERLSSAGTANALELRGVTKLFGALAALADISLSVSPGERRAVLGSNGAGKTTLFNVIAGHHRPTAGKVRFDGRDITGLSSDRIGRSGISRTFQAVHLFKAATVRENLRRAEVIARRHDPLAYLTRRSVADDRQLKAVVHDLGFEDLLDNVAGSLAYGLQKKLGVAMALMTSPKLLLMDEPVAGLNPSEKLSARTMIREIRERYGVTVLLVEHDMPLVMDVCDRILVVNQGRPIAIGAPAAIRADPQVIDAYLGEDYEFA